MTSRKTGPGAGGRWSDGEMSALVEAWGQIYLRRNRSSLRMDDWLTVCRAVNAHRGDLNRTFTQCRARLCTFKKKYKEEVAKGRPALGSPHFARLQGFLADSKFSNGPPPGFDGKTPAAAVKMEKEEEEEVEEEEGASGCVGRSAGRIEVPVKRQRHFSSLRDILERSGDPSLAKTPATVGCGCELVGGSATGVTKLVAEMRKLAEVHERVEMERHKFKKEMLKMKEEMELKDVRPEHKKVKENPKEADGK
ncbi:hypothetical protein ACQJBY_060131 [Aegilops geniculata]